MKQAKLFKQDIAIQAILYILQKMGGTYDSFLFASSVIERRLTDISDGIREGTTAVIGRMREEQIQEVVQMVRASKVISERHKRQYFY